MRVNFIKVAVEKLEKIGIPIPLKVAYAAVSAVIAVSAFLCYLGIIPPEIADVIHRLSGMIPRP